MTREGPMAARQESDAEPGVGSDVSLERYAQVSAALAEGFDLPRAVASSGLSVAEYRAAADHWTERIAADSMTGDGHLADVYAEAFVVAQDALAPVVEMRVEQWAALGCEIDASDLASALLDRGLSQPDYMRLTRHWAKALREDRALAKRYAAARVSGKAPA